MDEEYNSSDVLSQDDSYNNDTYYTDEDYESTHILTRLWHAGPTRILLYSVILVLAVIGNSLVILTLVQNKRMRTITNIFLLNLAVSDLLLSVFCMPFTLVGSLLQDFIFGHIMCKLVQYLQTVSVSVSSWSLVALSVERYYAICHPLRSRQWQTLSHSYKIIFVIWLMSFLTWIPIAILSTLQPLENPQHNKCRDLWPNMESRMVFESMLTVLLLFLPLFILTYTYIKITRNLREGIRNISQIRRSIPSTAESDSEMQPSLLLNERRASRLSITGRQLQDLMHMVRANGTSNKQNRNARSPSIVTDDSEEYQGRRLRNPGRSHSSIRHTHIERTITNKRRVIAMLCVVVLEFFICWTPLYCVNLLEMFVYQGIVYKSIGYAGINFIQLLAYTSTCCNPITYCFMNRNFKQAFKHLCYCSRMDDNRRWSAQDSMRNMSMLHCEDLQARRASAVIEMSNLNSSFLAPPRLHRVSFDAATC